MSMRDLRASIADSVITTLPWMLATLLVAGIVHIVSMLAMPRLAPRDAYARVAAIAPLNRIVLLPRTVPGAAATPFDDPALAQGVCRYDLAQGPLRLRGALTPDALFLFSFHARFGQLFYSMTDRGAARGRLDVLLLTPAQLDAVEANDSEDELPQELRIVAPTRQGFLLVRSLAERPDEFEIARNRIGTLACGVDRDTRS